MEELDRDAFVARYGPLFERSPWVAEAAWADRPFTGPDEVLQALCSAMYAAPRERRLALVRAHPELAGQAALTPAASAELASAGLAELSPEDRAAMVRLNAAYQERFGFPFVLAVRGHSAPSILREMEQRLRHTPDEELRAALDQVARIARLRFAALP